MLFNGDCLTKLELTGLGRPKELCELLCIVHIELIMFIDTLPISDVFSDRYALISFHGDDPEAQKRLWLHHINWTPHQGFEAGAGMDGFESGMFKQFDLHAAENGIAIHLTEVQEITDLDGIDGHAGLHAEVLPVNRIKYDREFFADGCYLFCFLASLLFFLSAVAA